MTSFIVRTVNIVFTVLLGIIIFTMGVALAETVLSGWMAICAAIILLILIFLACFIGRNKIRKFCLKIQHLLKNIDAWKLALVLGLFSAISKIIFVFILDNDANLHPDMAMYRSFAEQYALNGRITEYTDYAFRHTYTAIYGLILSPFASLFGSDTKVFTIVLSVLHSLAMVLLFDIAKKYAGKELSFSVLMLYCVLPVGLFQTQLLIHENGLLFFHVLAFWIFVKALDSKRHICIQFGLLFVSSCVLAIGKSINAAGQVFFISFAIYIIAKLFQNGISLKRVIKATSLILVLAIVYLCSSSIVDTIKISTIEGSSSFSKDQRKVPYGWTLYVGLNYDTSGAISKTDHDTYFKYKQMDNIEEAQQYQKDLINARIQTYLDNPIKMPKLIFNKLKTLWGMPLLPFAYEQGGPVNNYILHGSGGIIYKCISLLHSGSLLCLYSLTFIGMMSICKKKRQPVTPMIHCCMSVIGVTLALMPFEVTPKYVSHLSIMIFMVSIFAIKEALKTTSSSIKS